jgi:MSHA pilin protein MshD
MYMSSRRQAGFTLIELIIFIVVISVGIAGILSVMNTVVRASADPMVRKQAAVAAESILEEIMLKAYCDPDTVDTTTNPPTCGVNVVEPGRTDYDDVDDFNGKTPAQINALFADLLLQVPGYAIAITVANEAAFSGVNAKMITVTVSRGGEDVTLSSFRANY